MPNPTTEADVQIEALTVLRDLVGREDAVFHDGQWEAIRALVVDSGRALVVQRTGWGKSAVYLVATALLRARGSGPTVIVSPLLALMRDQVAAAARAGVRAMTVNSANAHEWGDVTAALDADEVDVLLLSPERLTNPTFRDEQLPALTAGTGLVVVDEAHCISDWGHDFRPDYRRIADLLATLPDRTPVLATTATANARVVRDVAEQLGVGVAAGAEVTTLRGGLARESLRLGVLQLPDDESRAGWLAAHLAELPGSGIVYALTVGAAQDLATLLRGRGHEVRAYTGRSDDAERQDLEGALRRNEVKALIATSALGMGFDKPDLGFVVHLGAPSSPVAYYQQVGRAGRATERADVLLLPGREDRAIWSWFATSSMPRQDQADAVLAALADGGTLSGPRLEALVDVRRTKLELLLKVLDVDGAVRRVKGGWESTGVPWTYDAERYERVAAARTAEQESMLEYQRTTGCRMAFLQRSLDDESARDCGRCDRCTDPWYPTGVPAGDLDAATEGLRRVGVELEPRRRWPTGADRLGVPVKGKVAGSEQLATGRTLARLTDLGWGQKLRSLLAAHEVAGSSAVEDAASAPVTLDPELVEACIRVLREWSWEARPQAVVSIPSRGRPGLPRAIAAALAQIGQLQDLGDLAHAHGGPTGGPGGNSAFRLAGVWDRIVVPPPMAAALADLGDAPVLLVDDLVDSRWTMTVAGRALRIAGAGAVLPFALAAAG